VRVLISAYACSPGEGSEPGAGFAILLAAAEEHDVWLVTRGNNVPALKKALGSHPRRERVRVIGFDLGEARLRAKRRFGRLGLVLYYDLWQRRVGDLLAELDRDHDFDVVHHATFASSWTRVGVATVRKPMVVGPVGGSVVAPPRLWPLLGFRGFGADLARRILRPVIATLSGARTAMSKASVVLLQSAATRPGGGATRFRILPNGLVGAITIMDGFPVKVDSEPDRLVFVGRLVGWKGARLAIRMMTSLRDTSLTLHIYGDGPQRPALARYASRLRLGDRITFHGQVSRHEALDAIASASVLVHPALNEESSVTVGEALSLGTPVLCLDHGGPPALLDLWPDVPSRRIRPGRPAPTAHAFAVAAVELAGARVPPDPTPGRVFLQGVLDAYDTAAGR
jgi:glycosyltransferase involved in cell wall biosynthesis